MKHTELIRKVKKYCRTNGLEFDLEERRGKGGHITIHVGNKFTTCPTGKKELKTGLQKAILKQLGIKEGDL